MKETSCAGGDAIMLGLPCLLAQDHFLDRTHSRTLNYFEVWEPMCIKSWQRLILLVSTYYRSLYSIYTNNWVQLAWECSRSWTQVLRNKLEGLSGLPWHQLQTVTHTLFYFCCTFRGLCSNTASCFFPIVFKLFVLVQKYMDKCQEPALTVLFVFSTTTFQGLIMELLAVFQSVSSSRPKFTLTPSWSHIDLMKSLCTEECLRLNIESNQLIIFAKYHAL